MANRRSKLKKVKQNYVTTLLRMMGQAILKENCAECVYMPCQYFFSSILFDLAKAVYPMKRTGSRITVSGIIIPLSASAMDNCRSRNSGGGSARVKCFCLRWNKMGRVFSSLYKRRTATPSHSSQFLF